MFNDVTMNFFRLNMSNDLTSLHIGDKILEVNGTPVKDQPVESIENLIKYSDTVLQVSFFQNDNLNKYFKRSFHTVDN